jgi:hypothetical protein
MFRHYGPPQFADCWQNAGKSRAPSRHARTCAPVASQFLRGATILQPWMPFLLLYGRLLPQCRARMGIKVPGNGGPLLENWFGRFAADCVGCTETLVAAPICEVTATEERHRLREIPLDAASEERPALLDKIKEWVDRARQAGNTQEATMREEATALLPRRSVLEAERTFLL